MIPRMEALGCEHLSELSHRRQSTWDVEQHRPCWETWGDLLCAEDRVWDPLLSFVWNRSTKIIMVSPMESCSCILLFSRARSSCDRSFSAISRSRCRRPGATSGSRSWEWWESWNPNYHRLNKFGRNGTLTWFRDHILYNRCIMLLQYCFSSPRKTEI